ncbi:MAG: ATP-binding cassette domain-containing protein [Candidatus Adiutrix sp.]|jgi:phospholipid/cholesterol/gamma-HCH transport system ATP-binding protein|nr:ATP-binding cassette domain-containing protein [Candidatus Adiutrix sp.]
MDKTMATPVRVEGLTVAYGQNPPILENLNFAIRTGEVFGILGGSGSGKSSVLRNLIGLVKPRAGQVFIFGQDMWAEEGRWLNVCRRRFGMMYQAGALFGSLNLLENVSMPLREFTDMSPAAVETAARMKLSLVGLAGFEYYLPVRISGGMQKRAAIARALALDPKLIFLDEPSAGLDPITSAGLDQLIRTLARNLGISFGVVTHELGSVMNIVDRAILLDKAAKGIVAEGRPADLAQMTWPPYVVAFFHRRPLEDEGKISEANNARQ